MGFYSMYLIGVDVGGMSVKIGLVSVDGNIISSTVLKTEKKNQEEFAKKIAITVNKLIEDNNLNKEQVRGIGIGCPGSVNAKMGKVIYAPNIPWIDLYLKRIVEDNTGIYTKVSNDADCAAYGEFMYGVAKGYRNVVLVTVGTGIGGGIIINRSLYEGSQGMASEIGHTTLVKDGRKCKCGRRGCFEQYASASALIRYTKDAMRRNKDTRMWDFVDGDISKVNGITSFAMAKQGDKVANEVVDNFVNNLSLGLLDLCNIFRPDCFIIGGGISKEGDYLINKIKSVMEKVDYGYPKSFWPEIKTAKLGNDAGIIGAASLGGK